MWWIVLSVVLAGAWLGFCIYMVHNEWGYADAEAWAFAGGICGTLLLALVLFLLSLFIIPATTGLGKNYSEGEIIGRFTEVACEGIIWKTHEAWLAIDAEEALAYQRPWKVSVPDRVLWNTLDENFGRKVRLQYRGWLDMPFRLGGTNYEVTELEWLE